MRIDQTDSFCIKNTSLNHIPQFAYCHDIDFKEPIEFGECAPAISHGTESHLSHNEWMDDNLPNIKMPAHLRIRIVEVIDPDCGVGQDHRIKSSTLLDREAAARDVFKIGHCAAERGKPARRL
jgi:hypothetical protein